MIETVLILAIYAVGVGTISSMVGIGGGIFNTPLLIILFLFDAQNASATALVAALFVAASSSIPYWRQKPRPTMMKAGLFLAIMTIPGSWAGIWLREIIAEDMILRYIFGISLFPVALKMLFAKKKKGTGDAAAEIENFDMSQLSNQRLVLVMLGAFIGGAAAGLLGIGGGAIVVPVLTLLMGLPIHAAVATSMFTMIFTASAGTVRNAIGMYINPVYALILGVGMVVGAQFGPRLATKVNSVQLKQVFGLILVFPLVKMMELGHYWLDPLSVDPNTALSMLGNIIIWLIVVIPIGLMRYYQLKKNPPDEIKPSEVPAPE
ncbi:MAG: sulfite exporter TauE/SafE family protein [Candidatus Thorarchaeota archaeon]